MIGGIHPEYNKLTADSKIVTAPAPKKVVLPLQQHIGAPCEPRVNVGDIVRSGQKIAEGKGFVSAPIHSSITGKVTAIGSARHPVLGEFNAITIEVVPGLELTEPEKKLRNPEDLNKDELKAIIFSSDGLDKADVSLWPFWVRTVPQDIERVKVELQ